jgi:hypothetical protein
MDGLGRTHSEQSRMAGGQGEHTVVHGGETGGDRLGRPWSEATTGSATMT